MLHCGYCYIATKQIKRVSELFYAPLPSFLIQVNLSEITYIYIYIYIVIMCSQCRSPWTHWKYSPRYNVLHQHKALYVLLGSALWRVSRIKNFKQRLISSCKVFFLEICKIPPPPPNHSGSGTYDKVTTVFFCFGFVLHLNVLSKHNKSNLWQVNTSFIASFVPAYFEKSGTSDKYQGTERCSETDRQTDSTLHSSMNNSSHSVNNNNIYVYTSRYGKNTF